MSPSLLVVSASRHGSVSSIRAGSLSLSFPEPWEQRLAHGRAALVTNTTQGIHRPHTSCSI